MGNASHQHYPVNFMCIILIILNSAHSSVTENAQESQDMEINSMGSHIRRAEQHYCQAHPLLWKLKALSHHTETASVQHQPNKIQGLIHLPL